MTKLQTIKIYINGIQANIYDLIALKRSGEVYILSACPVTGDFLIDTVSDLQGELKWNQK